MSYSKSEFEKVRQNLKIIKIMKSSGKTDLEIAKYLNMTTPKFLEIIDSEQYLKEIYEQASEKLVSDIEAEFLEKTLEKLGDGETTDAKWFLERRSSKYTKKDKMDVNVQSIDDVIREKAKEED